MLPLVIVNPASASGATGRAWPSIAADLRTHFGAFTPGFTGRQGEGRVLARRGADQGRSLIVACGGDGTINEVANGILESGQDAELGVLPSGTGGDFRRTLKLSSVSASAALSLREGRTRRIDVGQVRYVDQHGAEASRFFLNVASCGVGSQVVRQVKDTSRRLPSNKLAFALAAMSATLSYENPSVRLAVDNKLASRITLSSLCIANARYFGGGMKIAPTALLDDGQLDVVAIGDASALTIFANSYRLYLGTHLGLRQVHHTRARRLTVDPTADKQIVELEVDGELVGRLPASFEVIPGALRLRCPS